MKTLTLQLPDSVDEKDVKMQLAAHFYDKGIKTSGQAANMVGISKRELSRQLDNMEYQYLARVLKT